MSKDESTFHYVRTNDFFEIQTKIIILFEFLVYATKMQDPIDEILETGFTPTSFHAPFAPRPRETSVLFRSWHRFAMESRIYTFDEYVTYYPSIEWIKPVIIFSLNFFSIMSKYTINWKRSPEDFIFILTYNFTFFLNNLSQNILNKSRPSFPTNYTNKFLSCSSSEYFMFSESFLINFWKNSGIKFHWKWVNFFSLEILGELWKEKNFDVTSLKMFRNVKNLWLQPVTLFEIFVAQNGSYYLVLDRLHAAHLRDVKARPHVRAHLAHLPGPHSIPFFEIGRYKSRLVSKSR